MRIALVMLPAWAVDTPPLGVSYIAAALRRAGYEVTVFDYNVKLWQALKDHEPDLWEYGSWHYWELEEEFSIDTLPLIKDKLTLIATELSQGGYDAVGFSVLGISNHTAYFVASVIRNRVPAIKIFYGGSITWNSCTDLLLHENFDAAVVGEGERSVVGLIKAWESGGTIIGLPGIATKDSSGHIVVGPRQKPCSVDDLPLPQFNDYDLNKYRHPRSLPISMSRGCVGACVFCTEVNFWRPYRARSPENIMSEIRRDIERYGATHLAIADSLLNGHHKNLETLMDMILAEELHLAWGSYVRVDRRLTQSLIKKMAAAGCTRLSIGLESGSQKILQMMNKGTDVAEAARIIKDAFEAGIDVHVGLLIGFPGEEEEDIQATIKFLLANKEYIHTVDTGNTLGIGPNMAMWKQFHRFGLLVDEDDNLVIDKEKGWMTVDGKSTLPIRLERLHRIRNILQDRGIDYTPKLW